MDITDEGITEPPAFGLTARQAPHRHRPAGSWTPRAAAAPGLPGASPGQVRAVTAGPGGTVVLITQRYLPFGRS